MATNWAEIRDKIHDGIRNYDAVLGAAFGLIAGVVGVLLITWSRTKPKDQEGGKTPSRSSS